MFEFNTKSATDEAVAKWLGTASFDELKQVLVTGKPVLSVLQSVMDKAFEVGEADVLEQRADLDADYRQQQIDAFDKAIETSHTELSRLNDQKQEKTIAIQALRAEMSKQEPLHQSTMSELSRSLEAQITLLRDYSNTQRQTSNELAYDQTLWQEIDQNRKLTLQQIDLDNSKLTNLERELQENSPLYRNALTAERYYQESLDKLTQKYRQTITSIRTVKDANLPQLLEQSENLEQQLKSASEKLIEASNLRHLQEARAINRQALKEALNNAGEQCAQMQIDLEKIESTIDKRLALLEQIGLVIGTTNTTIAALREKIATHSDALIAFSQSLETLETQQQHIVDGISSVETVLNSTFLPGKAALHPSDSTAQINWLAQLSPSRRSNYDTDCHKIEERFHEKLLEIQQALECDATGAFFVSAIEEAITQSTLEKSIMDALKALQPLLMKKHTLVKQQDELRQSMNAEQTRFSTDIAVESNQLLAELESMLQEGQRAVATTHLDLTARHTSALSQLQSEIDRLISRRDNLLPIAQRTYREHRQKSKVCRKIFIAGVVIAGVGALLLLAGPLIFPALATPGTSLLTLVEWGIIGGALLKAGIANYVKKLSSNKVNTVSSEVTELGRTITQRQTELAAKKQQPIVSSEVVNQTEQVMNRCLTFFGAQQTSLETTFQQKAIALTTQAAKAQEALSNADGDVSAEIDAIAPCRMC